MICFLSCEATGNISFLISDYRFWDDPMSVASIEREWAERASLFVKAELKRTKVSYAELAGRLKEHGMEETEASIANKLARGTFAATFFFATMKAIGRENVNLADI
jgi:hypothetical protein